MAMTLTRPKAVPAAGTYFIPPEFSSWTHIDGEAVGRIIESMDMPTPPAVVDAARAEDSPLHRYFTWDDGAAAEKWRLDEARKLVRSIHVVVVGDDHQEYAVRAFSLIHVRTPDNSETEVIECNDLEESESRRYVPIRVVRANPEMARDVRAEAQQQLTRWYQTYLRYNRTLPGFGERFGPIFREIEKLSD